MYDNITRITYSIIIYTIIANINFSIYSSHYRKSTSLIMKFYDSYVFNCILINHVI